MNKEFAAALVRAQAEMPGIEKDSRNPHFRSEFVSLDHLLAEALPVLNRNGLAVAQFPTTNELGQPSLTTVLVHVSGDTLSYEMPLFLPKQDPQGQGSAITYARRYAIAAALGISSEKDDDATVAVTTLKHDQTAGEEQPDPSPAETRNEAASPGRPEAAGPQPAASTGSPSPASPDAEKFARFVTAIDETDVGKLVERIGQLDDIPTLRLILRAEESRRDRGKRARKNVLGALERRLKTLEGEPEGDTAGSPEAGQPADASRSPESPVAPAGGSSEPGSPSGNGLAVKVLAALAWIQDQPQTVENPKVWTRVGVLTGLMEEGVSAGAVEEVEAESLAMVWDAVPDGVRRSVEMLGPENLQALAAQAK